MRYQPTFEIARKDRHMMIIPYSETSMQQLAKSLLSHLNEQNGTQYLLSEDSKQTIIGRERSLTIASETGWFSKPDIVLKTVTDDTGSYGVVRINHTKSTKPIICKLEAIIREAIDT